MFPKFFFFLPHFVMINLKFYFTYFEYIMHFIWYIRYRMETHFHSWPPFSILHLYHTIGDNIYWPVSLFIHLVFVLASTCNTHKHIAIFIPILTHINISYCIYSLYLSLLTWKYILEILNDINSMQIISLFGFFIAVQYWIAYATV